MTPDTKHAETDWEKLKKEIKGNNSQGFEVSKKLVLEIWNTLRNNQPPSWTDENRIEWMILRINEVINQEASLAHQAGKRAGKAEELQRTLSMLKERLYLIEKDGMAEEYLREIINVRKKELDELYTQ